ncbi:hypothetical protein JB92DRAFT_2067944 [Gautieria morchelliformis]|nr:hypothetical protein JB92DRAFT_2067944 [Gautieria morchelliformis]
MGRTAHSLDIPMASPAPSASASTSNGGIPPPANRHAPTPLERQRSQLSKLLKDPSKPVNIPPPPKEKTVRPPREMMKNVQGSSAGAGSGEFHVYKANRRREYERLKLMEEMSKKEADAEEFERKRKEREGQADAKTSKNRAKRMKKKERAKGKGKDSEIPQGGAAPSAGGAVGGGPIKKRRLVNGSEMVFRLPGDESDEDEREGGSEDDVRAEQQIPEDVQQQEISVVPAVQPKITIYDSDT